MFAQLRDSRQTHWLAEAFSTLPTPVMTPSAAYQHLVRDDIEHVALEDLADRVLATSVVPYPPGIPMLMPGESTGADDGPYLGYLRALWAWDRRFPGFGHDTHGVENRDGDYYVQCLKAAAPRAARATRRRERARRERRGRRAKGESEQDRPQDVADAGDDVRGRQHDRHGRISAAGQPRAGRQHRDLRLAGRDARCRGAGARLREARRAQSAGGRSVRVRARLPRAVRGLSDQLRVLVRKLDRQHRDRGGGRGLSLGARSRNQQPTDERHRHGRGDLAVHVREHSRAARGRGAADLDGGARADPDPRRRVPRLVLVRFRELHLRAGT